MIDVVGKIKKTKNCNNNVCIFNLAGTHIFSIVCEKMGLFCVGDVCWRHHAMCQIWKLFCNDIFKTITKHTLMPPTKYALIFIFIFFFFAFKLIAITVCLCFFCNNLSFKHTKNVGFMFSLMFVLGDISILFDNEGYAVINLFRFVFIFFFSFFSVFCIVFFYFFFIYSHWPFWKQKQKR